MIWQIGQYIHNRSSALRRQSSMQIGRGLLRRNIKRATQAHRPGVQARIHLHNTHARLSIPGHNGPMDWRSTTPARQQAGVNIQTSKARCFQKRLRQDQPISHHHSDISIESREIGQVRRITEVFGRKNRPTLALSIGLYRRRASFLAPPRFARWLAVDADDLMPRFSQGPQSGDRKVRGAHKDYAHSLRAFLISMSRLSLERLSKYIRPFRWST